MTQRKAGKSRDDSSGRARAERHAPPYGREWVEALVTAMLDPVVAADGAGRVVACNLAAERLLGCAPGELVGRDLAELGIPPATRGRRGGRPGLERASQSILGRLIEVDAVRRDGSTLPVEVRLTRVDGPAGPYFVAAMRDLSERRQIEASLRRANAIVGSVSLAAEQLLETPSLEGGLGVVLERIGQATRSSRVFVYEHRADLEGEPVFIRRYRWAAPDIPTLDDRDELYAFPYRTMGWSRWAETLSRGGVISGHLRDFPASEQPELTIHGVKSTHVVPITVGGQWWGYVGVEDCVVERTWSEAEIEALRAAAGILGAAIARMQAEEALRRSEDQLRHAQRMEAIGRLAGGIAHDFNNLLLAIQGFSELALTELPPGAEAAQRDIEEVRRATERAAGLTRQLLAFSRRQISRPQVVDLNAVVEEMHKMLRRLIGEHIELVTAFDPEQLPIHADPGELEQVVANLAVNARDAMPDGGRLTLATRNATLAEGSGTLAPGSYAVLAVSDTGQGMDPETKARIFDPFFTTKGQGKGTGLGLSTVYGIVQQAGGDVLVTSSEGHGATLEVYMPRCEVAPADAAAKEDSVVPGGSETILVVEDEAQVRAIMVRILERLGYSVHSAATADEAWALLETGRLDAIDLLVTDLLMPGLPSRELVERVKAAWPDVKVLFVSGYSEDADIRRHVSVGSVELLEKPFHAAELARTIRKVLERGT